MVVKTIEKPFCVRIFNNNAKGNQKNTWVSIEIIQRFATAVGIPQDTPLSPILYLFYYSDLIEMCTDPALKSTATGFVDDIAVLVCGNSAEENLVTLQTLNTRTAGWSSTHASKFDHAKYKLIHFRPKPFVGPELPLVLSGKVLMPANSAKYLGVILENFLTRKTPFESFRRQTHQEN